MGHRLVRLTSLRTPTLTEPNRNYVRCRVVVAHPVVRTYKPLDANAGLDLDLVVVHLLVSPNKGVSANSSVGLVCDQ